MELYQFMASTLFGLEGLAAKELERLGLKDIKAEDGRVFCRGTLADLARMNLNLRTAERVMLVLGRFHAGDFGELFDGVKALEWEDFIPRDGAFPVKSQCVASNIQSELVVNKTIKKAVAERLGEKNGLTYLAETGAEYVIRCLMLKDQVTIGLDTSGASLHKRGYRALGVAAPLRETLAAGMVLLSRYRGKGALVDPFCGSGTIAIEAALIAQNRAPGLDRSFAAQRWDFVPREVWLEAADEAMDKEYHGQYKILASDIDPAAVKLARENARLAEVEDLIEFAVADATEFTSTEETGRIVTNPPYGQRLMEKEEAERLYRAFGKTYSRLPKGWELYLLSSHTEFERTFGRTADKKRKLYNGKLRCDLFQYR